MAFNDWAKIYFPISVEEGSDGLYTAIALSIPNTLDRTHKHC